MKLQRALLLAATLVACSNDSNSGTDHAKEDALTFGENVALPAGYTRYFTTVQELAPGKSIMMVEWIAEASDKEMDVLAVTGGQTHGGHHVTLSASSSVEPKGTVREYKNEDQLSARFLGAVGEGMGTGSIQLPSKYTFRLHKGEGLYLQTHYVNLTDAPIKVRSFVDVKMEEPSEERQVLSMFSNATLLNVAAPMSETKQTVECVAQKDLSLVLFSNHVHEWGVGVRTELVAEDGTVTVIKDDPVWNYEWTQNANFTITFDQPVVVKKGTKVRTHCTWDNDTTRELVFPDEMCIFVSFTPGEADISCTDGKWTVTGASNFATDVSRVGEGACSGDAAYSALPAVVGECLELPGKDIPGCGLPLYQGNTQCITSCFEKGNVPASCGGCYGSYLKCTTACSACLSDPASEACKSCKKSDCCPAFETCSGVSCPG